MPEPHPTEIAEALRPVHQPCASLEEALSVMTSVAGADVARYLAAEPGVSISWAVKSPRLASAAALIGMERARLDAAKPPPEEPQCAPVQCPHPSEIRDFSYLMAQGVEVVTAFYERYPADYARLKNDRGRRLDPLALNRSGAAMPFNKSAA